MNKFRKVLNLKILPAAVAIVFLISSAAYGIEFSCKTPSLLLRKQIDFNTETASAKYLCGMIAVTISKSILANGKDASLQKILNSAVGIQEIKRPDIKIEREIKKGTIWVYHETEDVYIGIKEGGTFTSSKETKTFRKAHIKESSARNSRLKKLFLRTLYAGTAGLTLLTITSLLVWHRINYDPFQGAERRNIEIYEDGKEQFLQRQPVSAQTFLDTLEYLQTQELSYDEVLNITGWLNAKVWDIKNPEAGLGRKDLMRLLNFLENPQPLKSSSVSSRWLVGITKATLLDLWLSGIYTSLGPDEYKAATKTLLRLERYKEYLPETDPLFQKYFPSIDPEEVLSNNIQEQAKREILYRQKNEDYWPQYSESYTVVKRLFGIFGTLEDIEKDLDEIHHLETADTIEIPIWQLDYIEYIRKLDPELKTWIEESAEAHNIPPGVILSHLLNVWKRNWYSVGEGIGLIQRRGKLTEKQAEWLIEAISKIDEDLLSKGFSNPNVMAFVGGVIWDAQSTTGIGRLRPVWVKRNQGFDRLGKDSENMPTRQIAWKLWSPKYNVEAIARLWEILAQEAEEAISGAYEDKVYDTRRFSNETSARLFVRNDTARVSFYKLCPSPEIFKSKGEAWMNSVWHPVEIEIQLQRMGLSPWHYNPGDFLPTLISIGRSGLFGQPGQKAVITGVDTEEEIAALREFLDSDDEFIRNAVIETLDRLPKGPTFLALPAASGKLELNSSL